MGDAGFVLRQGLVAQRDFRLLFSALANGSHFRFEHYIIWGRRFTLTGGRSLIESYLAMAKTKAELAQDKQDYDTRVLAARVAEKDGDFSRAVEYAVLSWPHIDGMMQYERKYEEKTFESVDAIDIFLNYAPLVFDFVNLDALAALLKTQRRIVKNTSADLRDALEAARQRMQEAHAWWDRWEGNGELSKGEADPSADRDQNYAQWIADHWEKMGLVRQRRDGGTVQIEFCTRMNERTSAKCPSCGVIGKAPKSKLLDKLKCPKCHARVQFVLLANPDN